MRKLILLFTLSIFFGNAFAQINKEQLALDVSEAEAANREKLEALIWKRYSTATVDGEVKAKLTFELSFDKDGKIQATKIGEETSVKKKPGIRGRIQKSTMDSNTEYIEEALKLTLDYTYMSKGQLLDFFEKSKITDKGKSYEIEGTYVFMEGDKLVLTIDKATLLFTKKSFNSKMGEDIIEGEIVYKTFDSGVSYGSTTHLNLPGKNLVIEAENKDFSKRIQ